MKLVEGRAHLSPSDLSVFLACAHATTLELIGTPRPAKLDPQVELIRAKGEEHEGAYLEELRAAGKTIREIAWDGNWDAAAAATEQAIRDGFDVVYQGVFVDGRWRGIADFLERRPDGVYEAVDTKLARHAKPAYILQLCFYDEQLRRIQGRDTEHIHVLLGSGERDSFRPEDFGAYYRRVRGRLERFVDDPTPTEAWPCDHCGVCDYKATCDEHWDSIDHLSRVAGMRRSQIEKLLAADIATLAALGRAPADAPPGLSAETYAKLREQAALQLSARKSGEETRVVLAHQPGAGFALLPEPSPGDLFFDFEGNPFWDRDGGLEYLWGILDTDRKFDPIWATDHDQERAALERFVDIVHARLVEFPDMHVYHYAQYEVTALKRLMGRYATREDEIDDLLRHGVFVDLLRVVRNGVRTSRPGYGLKELETFLSLEREAEVKDGGTSVVVFERWLQTRDDALLHQIEDYNREDCVATLLRDWLLELRAEAIEKYGPIPPLEVKDPKQPGEEVPAKTALQRDLIAAGHDVLAQLLEYHRREDKPVWWWFFERMGMTEEELREDAESIAGLELVGEPVVLSKPKRSTQYTLSFPAQESKLRPGADARDRATGERAGTIVSVDREAYTLVLERGNKRAGDPLPTALIPGGPMPTKAQQEALQRFGRSVLAGVHRYRALESILDRTPFNRDVQTTDLEEMKELVRSLDGRHLVIQGPPGSGKTWTCGRLIADLVARGKKVGVASTSHKAIHNLLDAVEDAAREAGLHFTGLKKASSGNPESHYESDHFTSVEDSDECTAVDVTGGTAWHFPRRDGELDYLFVDEAGQVSLADALAMGTSARNIVLVGDPQQLAQVVQGTHPLGTEASVLTWLLDGAQTIASNRGLFLERSFRLHPSICGYISEEFYESRLHPAPVAETRMTPFGTGLRYVEVDHANNRQESPEEVAEVARISRALLDAGVPPKEILVVAPYNAHVKLLGDALPDGVRAGTVDKFQGQEADIVLYSMASSSTEDVPHGLDFLLSRNRLNVAISRARCLAYLVASPRLLEVNCKTIEHMRLANALCRFVELAS